MTRKQTNMWDTKPCELSYDPTLWFEPTHKSIETLTSCTIYFLKRPSPVATNTTQSPRVSPCMGMARIVPLKIPSCVQRLRENLFSHTLGIRLGAESSHEGLSERVVSRWLGLRPPGLGALCGIARYTHQCWPWSLLIATVNGFSYCFHNLKLKKGSGSRLCLLTFGQPIDRLWSVFALIVMFAQSI